MRIIAFTVKDDKKPQHATRVGALLDDDFHVLDFAQALASSDETSQREAASDPLAWFDMASERWPQVQAAYASITSELHAQHQELHNRSALYHRPSIDLLAPVPRPGKLICIGLNYRDHAEESNMPIPKSPIIFSKFPTSVIATDQSVVLPKVATQVDYEAELAVVIGRRAKDVSVDDALDYVLGYTNLNDVSARDLQFADGQWQRGKSCDTFAPMGPYIVTRDQVSDPHNLSIKLRLNGKTMQDSRTTQLIFNIPQVIAFLTQTITLEPGDVIATGTPPGVGFAQKPPVYLKDGDVMEVEVEGLGVLTNRVESK